MDTEIFRTVLHMDARSFPKEIGQHYISWVAYFEFEQKEFVVWVNSPKLEDVVGSTEEDDEYDEEKEEFLTMVETHLKPVNEWFVSQGISLEQEIWIE